jgi:hypothetical protein
MASIVVPISLEENELPRMDKTAQRDFDGNRSLMFRRLWRDYERRRILRARRARRANPPTSPTAQVNS